MPSTPADVARVAKFFRSKTGYQTKFALAIREAIDMVLDGRHTGRCSIEELDKVEKTFIGTKVEHMIIYAFKLKKYQRLDTRIDGVPVDIKCTVDNNWSIPVEAINEICLVVRINEKKSKFSVGLVLVTPERRNGGENNDGKAGLSKAGRESIEWLVNDGNLPKNFLFSLPEATRQAILAPGSGTSRMAELFRKCVGMVVDGVAIETVGQQRDSSKRVRGDGGARSVLEPEGIVILSNQNNQLLRANGFAPLKKGEFMSLRRSSDGKLLV